MTTEIVAQPAARLADSNWDLFKVEAEALANELESLGHAPRFAGIFAAELVDELIDFAGEWDAMSAAVRVEAAGWADLAHRVDAGQLADGLLSSEPEPTPPAPISITERARDKAAYRLADGVAIRRAGDAWLVPSANAAGVVYRVEAGCCNCAAAQAGRSCWHTAAVSQLQAAPAKVAA